MNPIFNSLHLLTCKFDQVAKFKLAGVIIFWLCSPAFCFAQTRIALVIGNSNYHVKALKNPVNDATDMAAVLQKLNFEVDLYTDIDRKQMRQAIRGFGHKLKRADVGLFYFAGHGIQIKGTNYLVPLATNIASADEVQDESIDANSILRKMETAGNDVNIVILDACRNNPFASSFRSLNSGLAKMDGPVGSLIAYATAPGSEASDGMGRNGLYTQHLLAALHQPGLTIEQTFKAVRNGVRLDTDGKQIPWESSSLTGEFVFLTEPNQSAITATPPLQQEILKGHLQVITNVPNAQVSINNRQRGLTDENGVLNIPDLTGNTVDMVVMADGYQQHQQKVKLVPREWKQATLELDPVINTKASQPNQVSKANERSISCFKDQNVLLDVQAQLSPRHANTPQNNHHPQLTALLINAMQKQQLKVLEIAKHEHLSDSADDYESLSSRYNANYAIAADISLSTTPITVVKTNMQTIHGDFTVKLINLITAEVLATKTNSFQRAGMHAKPVLKKIIKKNINVMMQDLISESCPSK
jgi:hypothetical protein